MASTWPPVFSLIGLERLPEIFRVVARQAGERKNLRGLVRPIAKDDDAVEIISPCVGGPLVSDEGGEPSRIIVFLGGFDVLFPDRSRYLGEVRAAGSGCPCRDTAATISIVDLHCLLTARLEHVVPAPQRRVFHQRRITLFDLTQRAHNFGVVRDDQEVERATQAGTLPGGGNHLFAAGKSVRVFGPQCATERNGVERLRSMQVGIAPVDPLRKESVRVWRIRSFLGAVLSRCLGAAVPAKTLSVDKLVSTRELTQIVPVSPCRR